MDTPEEAQEVRTGELVEKHAGRQVKAIRRHSGMVFVQVVSTKRCRSSLLHSFTLQLVVSLHSVVLSLHNYNSGYILIIYSIEPYIIVSVCFTENVGVPLYVYN